MSAMLESLESRQHLSVTSTQTPLNPRFHTPTTVDSAADDQGRTYVASIYREQGQISVIRVVDGKQDTSYGKNGFAIVPVAVGGTSKRQLQVTVDHAGRVVMLHDRMLTRLASNGKLDITFGTRGKQPLPIVSKAADVAVDSKNRPVVVGTSAGKTGDRGTLLRLTDRGALDKSFGGGGTFKTPVPIDAQVQIPGNASGRSLRVLANDQIVGAIHTKYLVARPADGGESVDGARVFRVNPNGSLDTSYGTMGYSVVERESGQSNSHSATVLSILSDGSYFVDEHRFSWRDEGGSFTTDEISFYNASGALTKYSVKAVPRSIGRATDIPRPIVLGRDDEGRYLLGSHDKTYRLGADFSFDTSFTPVSGSVIGGNVDAEGTVTVIGSARKGRVYVTTIKA